MPNTLLTVPDKFRGTASALQVADAVSRAAATANWVCDSVPMADGGEGLLDVLGGPNRETEVTGPLGTPVSAGWLVKGPLAVIEMARASGLLLAGGPEGNDPLTASTKGTGELILQAMKSGATQIVVGMGGSATTDGGLQCLKELWPQTRLREIDLTVLCDVDTRFVDAAKVFGAQKGATESQIALLTGRLQRLVEEYEKDFGVNVSEVPGGGAAGGLAGGLVAVGADIMSGFDYLADYFNLDERIEAAQLVVTGEGSLDETSLQGKVVCGTVRMAKRANVPVVVIAGIVEPSVLEDELLRDVHVISLSEKYGLDQSMNATTRCIERALSEYLATHR